MTKNKYETETVPNKDIYTLHHSNNKKDKYICCVCGEEQEHFNIHEIEINNELRHICKGCAEIVHGLL
jgi:hypothetical protein